jgi:WD40 repeat protein
MDKKVRLWQVKEGKLIQEFKGHARDINDIVFLSDKKVIATAGAEGFIIFWDIASAMQIYKLKIASMNITSINYIATENILVASVSYDKNIHIYTLNHLLKQKTNDFAFNAAPACEVTCVSMNKSKQWLAITGSDHYVYLIDLVSRKEIKRFEKLCVGESDKARALFSPDEKWLAMSGGFSTSVSIFDVDMQKSYSVACKIDQTSHYSGLMVGNYILKIVSLNKRKSFHLKKDCFIKI